MITITIAITLATLAIPSYSTYLNNKQLQGTSGDFSNTLQFARAEALRGGKRVFINPVDGADWTTGSVVWQDDGNQICDVCTGDDNSDAEIDTEVMRGNISGTPDITFYDASGGIITPVLITFDSRGFSNTAYQIRFCDQRSGENGRMLNILLSGFMVFTDPADDSKACS